MGTDDLVRPRRRPWLIVAVVVLGIAAFVSVLASRGQRHPAASPATAASAVARVALPGCAYPAAPAELLDEIPPGPATGAITGTTVTRSFAFTDAELTIAPPPVGYRPAVTQTQADCQLTSAVGGGAAGNHGVVALATVTFAGALPAGVPAYQGRVAWVLVSESPDIAPSCPAVFPQPSAPATSAAPYYGPHQVVAIDAATGASAVYMDEHYSCTGTPPAPTVGVPLQIESVPWTSLSRSADGTTVTLRAGWPACEAFAGNQLIGPPPGFDAFTLTEEQRVSGIIPVRVWRPLGLRCGPDVSHDITVSPDIAGRALPSRLLPAALGVESGNYVPPPVQGAPASPAPVASSGDSCADPAAANQLLLADAPPGPAHGKAVGDVVTTGWSLDGGELTVASPPDGFRPSVDAGTAGCRLAFMSRALSEPAAPGGRLELGTVTISAGVYHLTPGVPSYQHRVAWLLVTDPSWTYYCLGPDLPVNKPYEVLMLDARTGDAGVTYVQGHADCERTRPPQVGVPAERRSVPWTVVSRNADDSRVVIAASWPSCETFTPIYLTQVVTPTGELEAAAVRDDPTLIAIQVGGRLGTGCGPPRRHLIVVGPATAGRSLSATLGHGPVGALDNSATW